MSRVDKRLQKMRQNPRDWRIEEIQSVADSLGIEWLHDGGSHVIFQKSGCSLEVSVPARKPIKPVYVRRLIDLIDAEAER